MRRVLSGDEVDNTGQRPAMRAYAGSIPAIRKSPKKLQSRVRKAAPASCSQKKKSPGIMTLVPRPPTLRLADEYERSNGLWEYPC